MSFRTLSASPKVRELRLLTFGIIDTQLSETSLDRTLTRFGLLNGAGVPTNLIFVVRIPDLPTGSVMYGKPCRLVRVEGTADVPRDVNIEDDARITGWNVQQLDEENLRYCIGAYGSHGISWVFHCDDHPRVRLNRMGYLPGYEFIL